MDNLARSVCDWLQSLPNIRDVLPCRVTLGDGEATKQFLGARYTQVGYYTEMMMAVTHGDKKAGEEYTTDHIFLVGKHPSKFKGRAKFCFPYEGQEWCYACYCDEPERTVSHPFGASFVMFPWDVPGSKVDDGQPRPYLRVPMTLEYLA